MLTLIERTTRARQVALVAVLAVLIVACALGGCSSTPREWCDDNPRMCEVAVVGGAVVAGCLVGYGLSQAGKHNGVQVTQKQEPPLVCYQGRCE